MEEKITYEEGRSKSSDIADFNGLLGKASDATE
jgi:hypothetical protein